jgi:hypothetical protein
VLQTPSGDLFAKCRSTLLYGIAGHELVSNASFRFDLPANIVVKTQNALVIQIGKTHKTLSKYGTIAAVKAKQSRPAEYNRLTALLMVGPDGGQYPVH